MRTKLMHPLVLVLLTLFAGAASNAATRIVKIGESGTRYFFNPTNIVIHTGDVIRWTNTVANPHDSTHRNTNGQAMLWASPKLSNNVPNNTFSFTFTTSGSYPYYCLTHVLTHPEQTGTVAVVTMNLPPSVNITLPTNGTRYFEPARFTIQVSASDLDGNVAQVELFSGSTSLGIRTNTPYSMSLSNVA